MHHSVDWLVSENYDLRREGLVAKLQGAHKKITSTSLHKSVKQNSSTYTSEADSGEDDEPIQQQVLDGICDSDNIARRVRSRSLIDEEQLAVLKRYYAVNSRPKKEEISMIADYINFPSRVVQVCTL